MRCIDKLFKKPQKRTGRFQKRHQQKVRKTLFLLLLLIIFLLLGLLAIILIGKNRQLKEILPYDRSQRVFGTTAGEDYPVADGLSQNLCVGEAETSLEGVEAKEGERAGLFDIHGRKISFSTGLYERVSPGTVTQLMTALVAFEKLNPDDTVTISQEDMVYGQNRNTCGLSADNQTTVKQLLNAVLVSSAQDACLALARSAGGSADAFVDLMNQKAQDLGMTNTNFVNATGVSDENQYTTVYDIYLLLNELLKYPDLTNAMGLSEFILNYSQADGTAKQQWLSCDNLYATGRITVPRGVTVLGGKFFSSDTERYTALLVQNNYGNAFAAIVFQSESETEMNNRIRQMLEKINS